MSSPIVSTPAETETAPMTEMVGGATDRPGRTRGLLRLLPAVVIVAVLAYLPYVSVEVPGLLPGRVNGPGTMQLLATCLVMAGIALSYDVIFGRTGLLSFGHALFVAAGSYLLTISLSTWSLPSGHRSSSPSASPCSSRWSSGPSPYASAGSPSPWSPWPSRRPRRSSCCATPVT
jgi:branched-chain amino acid transport system permease protein